MGNLQALVQVFGVRECGGVSCPEVVTAPESQEVTVPDRG